MSRFWHHFAECSLATHTCGSMVSFFMVAIISVSRSITDCCFSMQAFTSLEIELAGELPIIKASCESRTHLVASSNDFRSFWTIGIRRCEGSPQTNTVVFSWSLLLSLFAKLWIVEMHCSRFSPFCMVLFHKVCSIIHVGCLV